MNAVRDLEATTSRSVAHPAGTRRARRSDAMTTQLVKRAAEGDQHAWNTLVEDFGALVWSTARAYRLSEADAAEVSQITWLRLVENLPRLRDRARVGAWLATTARRESLRQLRRISRVIPDDALPEQAIDPGAAPDAVVLANERDCALWSAVAALPERDRRLLRMLMSHPAPSYAEISTALQMPIGSIGPTRERALRRLRREAARHGLDDINRAEVYAPAKR